MSADKTLPTHGWKEHSRVTVDFSHPLLSSLPLQEAMNLKRKVLVLSSCVFSFLLVERHLR